MNNLINELNINIKGIRYLKNVKIIDSDNNKYVVKKNNKKTKDIYDYLINKGCIFFPKIYTDCNSEYEISDYISDIDVEPLERIEDMTTLIGILHNKTTYYKELCIDEIKKTYEEISEQLNYLFNYYNDLEILISEEIYMEPSDYQLIINISKIYRILYIGKDYLEKWYNEIKDKKTIRMSMNHQNLKKEHLIEGNISYLISWDKAKRDYPISDIISIFKNNYRYINLDTILYKYEIKNKLYQYEYFLLISKLCILKKIDIKKDLYNKMIEISDLNIYLDKLLDYLSKQNKNETNNDK